MNNSNTSIDTNDESEQLPIDSIIEVSISNNKLEASVNIKPPQNEGLGPNIESLREIIGQNNITYGINEGVLFDICENPQYDRNIVIAVGTSPVNGVDGTYQIQFDTTKDSKPKQKEDGSVDFYNLENVENVKQDQLLCTITHPAEGTDGMSVLGKTIPCIKGKPVTSLLGKNTKLSEDGTQINSKIDGQVDYTLNKINVHETLYIKNDVDTTTGNIKVVGNVIISGSVLSGFVVESTGNIQIYGGLSAVTLIAGGNIILGGGIIGGKLTCEGDLTSKFVENCDANVKGDIKTDYIYNSNITCGKSIYADHSISKIVGGSYFVGEDIRANTIGSKNATVKTYLEIGTDPATLNKQRELTKEISLLETQLDSFVSLISLLKQLDESGTLTLEKRQIFDDALFGYREVTESIENVKLELAEVTELIRTKEYGRVICIGTIHTGTTIKIGSVKATIKEPIIGKLLYYSEEGICIGDA